MKYFIATACLVSLSACAGTTPLEPAPSAFPSVSAENAAKFNTTSCKTDPTSRSQNARVGPVNIAAGFRAHVVKLCDNGALVENVVFWSRTNEDGTNIEGIVTTLDGARFVQAPDTLNQPTGTNYFDFQAQTASGTPLNCTVIKPPYGISPASLAICQS